jgi:hypothetical protein
MQAEMIETLLEIGKKRRAILSQIREAIRSNDHEAVFQLARKLTGLSDEECNRTNPRLN